MSEEQKCEHIQVQVTLYTRKATDYIVQEEEVIHEYGQEDEPDDYAKVRCLICGEMELDHVKFLSAWAEAHIRVVHKHLGGENE